MTERKDSPRRSATSNDVARIAGVSQATVSRALAGDRRITASTRRRVEQAAAELGYIPLALGRNLARRHTRLVGIVAADLVNPYYPILVNAISKELDQHDYRAVLFLEDEDNPDLLRALANGSVDGVVIAASRLDSVLPGRLVERGLPVSLVNRYVDGLNVDCCIADNYAGARRLAGMLIELGHRRFALINGSRNASTGRDRERGYLDTLEEAGLRVPAHLNHEGVFSYETGKASMLSILDGDGDAVTAVMCGNDIIALGALDAAFSRGVRVPADVSITGFDDMPMAAWSWTNLTTVRQESEALAQGAVRLLLDRVVEPSILPRRVEIASTLVTRGTHSPPRRP